MASDTLDRRPRGVLFDYGGTLLEEVAFDTRAGIDLMLAHAASPLAPAIVSAVRARAERVTREVAGRRDTSQTETPWASLTRLIYDPFLIQFTRPLADLELLYWDACAKTRPMPGVLDALTAFQRAGVPMGLVSNSLFSAHILRHELAKHALSDFLSVVVVSADYVVRKPNPMLFDVAASLLGVPSDAIWFIGDRLDTDVAGAKAAGMLGVHYSATPLGDSRNALGPQSLPWPEIMTRFRDTLG